MTAVSIKRIRCAIYTRVSTDNGLDQEFNSLDAQYEASQAYIRSQAHAGWTLIRGKYDDGGFSGGDTDRPALQQLLEDVQAGRIDVIVVYKVDRLTRSLADFAKLVELFDKHTVSFVSVTQQFNTPMVHTAVVLPRALLDQLRRDGKRSERGLSTEIRQRLQASYRTEELPRDPETAELVEFVGALADSLERDLGKKWHQSKYVRAALKGGLATYLAQYQPEGEAGVYDPGDPSDNPETVGRTHARLKMAARRGEN